jgi:ribokinase
MTSAKSQRAGEAPDILIVGHTSIDDIHHEGYEPSLNNLGGAALYALRGATIWPDVTTGVVTLVGDGFDLQDLRAASANPDTTNWSGARRCDGPTIMDAIHHFADGTRKVTFAEPARVAVLTPGPTDVPPNLLGSRFVHLTPGDPKAQAGLAEQASWAQSVVSWDSEIHYLDGCGKYELGQLLSSVDILMPSLEQMPYLVGGAKPGSTTWFSRLRSLEAKAVVVKSGADGSLVFDGDTGELWSIPAPRGVHILDPIGAGDAYCGGFLAGLVRTNDLLEAAIHGTVSASVVLETRGANAASITPMDVLLGRARVIRSGVRRESKVDR